jgi:cell shape-determining protein MreD
MRWPVFVVFAFVALTLEVSLRNTLRLESLWNASPSFVACLAVLVAMFTNRLTALWACWMLGVLMDLLQPGQDGARVIGPFAIGFVFAGYIITLLRTMVFRRKAITMGAMTFVFLLASDIVAVFVLTIRTWYPDTSVGAWSPMRALAAYAMEALYGGVIAIPVGWLLLLTLPIWGFPSAPPRRGSWF